MKSITKKGDRNRLSPLARRFAAVGRRCDDDDMWATIAEVEGDNDDSRDEEAASFKQHNYRPFQNDIRWL